MARRSAGNPRYRKDATLGSTRRSAASAKPKRDAGEAPPKRGSSAGKKGGGKPADWRTATPDSPEYRRLRKVWFILLMVAIAASVAGWMLRREPTYGTVALGLAYASLFVAFGIDMFKIKPMRKAWVEEAGGGKKKTPAKDEGASKDSSDEGKAD